ncbi:hypothetical protein IFM89_022841 [Coptis chinensis]|uniref:Uncharacterized protein n=1 Tax=Coptis chinensis TaxID=261450 RepID=A0A835IXA9_9MAGN|nr:hypothetical protein IFM89_022841 [Coptis chinensis]
MIGAKSRIGGDYAYYENSKAKLDRLFAHGIGDDFNDNSIYGVAAKTIGVKVQKVVGPEVSALLDHDSDMSRFGSDVEDLEEDFVVQENVPEEGEGVYKKIYSKFVEEKPRVRRLLDEQFDMVSKPFTRFDCFVATHIAECETESDSELNGYVVAEGRKALQINLIFPLKAMLKMNWNLMPSIKFLQISFVKMRGQKMVKFGGSHRCFDSKKGVEYGEMCDNDDDEGSLGGGK